MKAVDIIVPIYNAYDDLVLCIASVKRHTDLTTHRLILINDCSPDERILPLLRSEEKENVIVIDNEANAGFSNNVNKGMLYSEDRDVILLNSDTIVTEGWVEKIVECAYSKPEIGTVTPMSNSATLCSYPVFCQDNLIPENWTVDSLAQVVERCSMKIYPRITVAVGFCMFIKRETITKVGLFDAKTYERGYGEENDFCNRAEQLGYIHVMCDNTFIYHKGTVSFLSEQKMALIEAHEKILVERYPEQMKRNSNYVRDGLDQYIRDNISIYTKANPNKKNLMYLVQADFRKDAFDNMGGTQHHVRDLTMNLKDAYNVYVVARDREYLRVTMYSGEETMSLKYYIGAKEAFPRIHETELARLLKNILAAFQINMLHVHHVHGLSFDIFDAAKELNIPVVLTMHDFYYACPNVKLVNAEGKHCKANCDAADCEACLTKNAGIYTSENYLDEWRRQCQEVFAKCEKLIVPSQAAKEVYLRYYPHLEDKITVIEHGLEIEKEELIISADAIHESPAIEQCFEAVFSDAKNPCAVKGWGYIAGLNSENVNTYLEVTCAEDTDYFRCNKVMRMDVAEAKMSKDYTYSGFEASIFKPEYVNQPIKLRLLMEYEGEFYTSNEYYHTTIAKKEGNSRFNVAFLGGMVPEKGSKKAYEMINSQTQDIRWHVFGSLGDKDLAELESDNLIKHGTYRQEDIPQLMSENKIDLVCIMSIWPETFCYTLSEAVTCKIPVLVTDIGAAGERVRRHGYGWVISEEATGAQMAEYVHEILSDEEGYQAKKTVLDTFEEITLKEMSEQYIDLYNTYQRDFNWKTEYDTALVFKGLGIPAGIRNVPFAMVNENAGSTKSLQKMQDIWEDYVQAKRFAEEVQLSRGYKLLEKARNNRLIRVIRKIVK